MSDAPASKKSTLAIVAAVAAAVSSVATFSVHDTLRQELVTSRVYGALTAPAVPTPPKVRGKNAMLCVAVFTTAPVAVNVNVTVACAVLWKAPTTVPAVNGLTNTCGESVPSVFVMFALSGSVE